MDEVKKPVASTLFVIKRIQVYTQAIGLWELFYKTNQFDKVLTPSNKPVSDEEVAAAYKALVFITDDGVVFDTENWYCIKVKELKDPILIYEGSAFPVEIAGLSVFAPMLGTNKLHYDSGTNPPEQTPFWFGLTVLPGYGPRLAIKLCP